MTPIRIAAALIMDGAGRVLLVRKRGTRAFMQAGGKIDPGETPLATLRRELREELGVDIGAAEPKHLGRFSADAAHEPGRVVEAEIYLTEMPGPVAPSAEIEEIRWVHPGTLPAIPLAPLTQDHVLPMAREITKSSW